MIDIIIFAVAVSFGVWVAIVLGLIAWGVRVWARRACVNDIDRNAPRVRARVRHSPIETGIADVLHREYPSRKPAQFV